jgi:hypothetical protein
MGYKIVCFSRAYKKFTLVDEGIPGYRNKIYRLNSG